MALQVRRAASQQLAAVKGDCMQVVASAEAARAHAQREVVKVRHGCLACTDASLSSLGCD